MGWFSEKAKSIYGIDFMALHSAHLEAQFVHDQLIIDHQLV